MRKKEMISRIEELENENRELKHKNTQMYYFMKIHPDIKEKFEEFCHAETMFYMHLVKSWMIKTTY